MDIQQFLLILRARLWLILTVLVVTVGTTASISVWLPKNYTATASLVVDLKGADPVGGMMLPNQMLPGYLATQIDIITSKKVALKVVKNLRLAENATARRQFEDEAEGKGSIERWLAELLLRKLDVKPARESSVINIDYEASDPRFAAVVANAFAQAYIETNLELRVEPARQTAAWFDGQMKTLRDNLENAQNRLSKYQRDTGIIAADERIDVESARLADLSSQLVATQGQTYESQNRERKARELIAKGASADELVEVLNQPVVIGLKADISRLEAKVQDISSQLGVNHPQYQQAQAQVTELKRKLESEIANVTKGLGNTNTINQRREAEIKAALDAQKAKVLQIKQQRDEMTVLMREVEGAQKGFEVAMARYTQTSLESQTNQTNIAVLNPADEPTKHSSPQILLNILLALALGSMLGVGTAFALETADRRIRSVDDLKTMFDLPVLGVASRERGARKRFRFSGVRGQRAPAAA